MSVVAAVVVAAAAAAAVVVVVIVLVVALVVVVIVVAVAVEAAGIRLTQWRARSKFVKQLFHVRALAQWNSLLFSVSGYNSLNIFKSGFFNYLLAMLH